MDGTSANRVELGRTLQNAASVRFCIDGFEILNEIV